MKQIRSIGAQGDVIFQRVSQLPKEAKIRPASVEYIVAHSETGHHHVAKGRGLRCYDTSDPLVSFLEMRGPIQIRHERSFATHETVELLTRIDDELGTNAKAKQTRDRKAEDVEPTYYKVIRQRQHTPEGWVRVVD